jgi:5'-methylthioadenosine phosphorylase
MADLVAALPTERDCPCTHALDGIELPTERP